MGGGAGTTNLATASGLATPQVQQQAATFNQMVAAQDLRRQQVNAFAAARFARFVQIRRAVRAQQQAEPIRGPVPASNRALAARRGSSPAPIRLVSDSADSDRPRITVFGRS